MLTWKMIWTISKMVGLSVVLAVYLSKKEEVKPTSYTILSTLLSPIFHLDHENQV
jgi:hypothetical protein